VGGGREENQEKYENYVKNSAVEGFWTKYFPWKPGGFFLNEKLV